MAEVPLHLQMHEPAPELKEEQRLRFLLIKRYFKTRAEDSFRSRLRFAAAFSPLEFGVFTFHLSFSVVWMCEGMSQGSLKSSGEKS